MGEKKQEEGGNIKNREYKEKQTFEKGKNIDKALIKRKPY